MSYKKRGRAGWTGKKEAKSKIGRERNYAKKEIKQAMAEIEVGDEYRYSNYSKKTLTPEEKKVKRLNWYQRVYSRWTRPNEVKRREHYGGDGWFARHVNSIRSNIERLKDELKKTKKDS